MISAKSIPNLARLWTLAPEYVKLDGGIIQQAEFNPRLQRILPKLVEIIRELHAEVVIEGVETQAQLELARHAGIHLMQGYLLGRPADSLSCTLQETLKQHHFLYPSYQPSL